MRSSHFTIEFARKDDCLNQMVPSDLRLIIADRDYFKREYERLINEKVQNEKVQNLMKNGIYGQPSQGG